jgi:hypothetical protein
MPCDYRIYPPDWRERRERILKRAHNQCEWPGCHAENGKAHPITGSKVVLIIAHMDHDPENWKVEDKRLRAWCQLHHNRYDREHRNETRKRKLEEAQPTLF